jgi:AhpD family alkylhydroperoxidase
MRLDYKAHAPDFAKAMARLGAAAGEGPLDRTLRELVRTHISMLNGCAYCVDMHTKDARALGETEQRLYALPVWREVPYFTDRERVALALSEAVTVLTRAGVPDAVWAEAAAAFDEEELAQLLATMVATNAWNRIGVAARCWTPGTYQP